MIYKRNIFQKAVSLLLTVSLLVPGMGATARAEAPGEPVEKPQLRVVGTLTDGGKYLELGLSIDGKAASFQSAGVLLKYDATKLSPLKWGTIEDESGVPADAKIPVSSATTVETAWNEASVLPTKSKGADDLVGKTAKAVKLSESATSAYLYLSAEAPKGRTLKQLLPVETGTAPEGLPTATASGKPITAIGAADAPADQVVTVRFLVGTTTDAGEGAVERNYTLAELVAAIDLVVYDPTSATPDANERALLLASPLTLSTNVNTKLEGLSYIADNTDYTTAGFTTAADVSFLWVAAGQTVDSGGEGKADPSSCASIVFYDWQLTYLGSIVVVKGQDATDLVRTFEQGLTATEEEKAALNTADKTDLWANLPDKPLTYKKGYSFEGCWLPYDSEIPTVYGTRVDALNANTLTMPERPISDEVDFTNITENISVKAAYNENIELDKATAVTRRYTAEAVSYTRFGTTVNYGITVEIRRENASGKGAPRIINPALRVTLSTAAGNIMMLLPLESDDVTTAQIVANGSVTQVSWAVVETFNNQNWIGAGGRTANTSSKPGTMNVRDSGFLYYCTFGGINNMLEEYTLNPITTIYNYVNMNSLTGIGLTVGTNNIAQAKDKLLAAWQVKNSTADPGGGIILKPKEERVGLTFEEMNAALAS